MLPLRQAAAADVLLQEHATLLQGRLLQVSWRLRWAEWWETRSTIDSRSGQTVGIALTNLEHFCSRGSLAVSRKLARRFTCSRPASALIHEHRPVQVDPLALSQSLGSGRVVSGVGVKNEADLGVQIEKEPTESWKFEFFEPTPNAHRDRPVIRPDKTRRKGELFLIKRTGLSILFIL